MYCCNRRGAVKGIVGFVILFNAFQLCYFVSRSWPLSGRAPEPTIQSTGFSFHQGKPWPAIPSFRPWLADPELAPLSSCEAYFGNGFTRVYSLLEFEKEKADDQLGPGSFQCHFSETLQTSICEGKQVVMNPQNITMTKGGESLESVVHRSEEDELPTYSEGAFQIISEHKTSGKLVDQEMLDNFMPGGQVRPHRIRMLLESMQVIQKSEAVCSEKIAGPTLFVTRYEYANLFHTVTDWYSAYASSRVIGLKQRPRVVLLDGHCKSALEDGWEVLFSGVEYAKHFSGSVCFEHAIFAPLGYNTALFEALGSSLPCQGCSVTELEEKFDSSKTARLREFGEVFTAAFDVPNFLPDGAHQNESGKRELKLLFIRRENYMAHPRHSGKLEVRLSNEEELLTALQKWSADMKDSNEAFNLIVVNGLFAHMTLAEQIRAVQASSIIIGAHGAGLTHIIFSKPGTVVFEMLSPLYMRPHYRFISQWLGSDYHYLVTRGSSVNCSQVVASLSMIVPNLVKQTDMIV